MEGKADDLLHATYDVLVADPALVAAAPALRQAGRGKEAGLAEVQGQTAPSTGSQAIRPAHHGWRQRLSGRVPIETLSWSFLRIKTK